MDGGRLASVFNRGVETCSSDKLASFTSYFLTGYFLTGFFSHIKITGLAMKIVE
jgi:hypothetical protein